MEYMLYDMLNFLNGLAFWTPILMTLLFFVSFGLAAIPGEIASKKGYSFILYYIFGFFFFVPALIVSLLLIPKVIIQVQEVHSYKVLLNAGIISEATYRNNLNRVVQERQPRQKL